MLTLVLMRHGDASFDAHSDFHRRLSNRGILQVSEAARNVVAQGLCPSVIISSDAPRAAASADILAGLVSGSSCRHEHFLYEDYTTQQFMDLLARVGDDCKAQCIAVVAHNPDLSHKAMNLIADRCPVSFPTAGVLVLNFNSTSWSDIEPYSAQICWCSF